MSEARQKPATRAERRADQQRAKVEAWCRALVRHRGNIARASAEAGFSRQRGYALTKRYGLSAFAAGLRAANGQPLRGRPRKEKC